MPLYEYQMQKVRARIHPDHGGGRASEEESSMSQVQERGGETPHCLGLCDHFQKELRTPDSLEANRRCRLAAGRGIKAPKTVPLPTSCGFAIAAASLDPQD